jgi:AcrR family transcriptional regulator
MDSAVAPRRRKAARRAEILAAARRVFLERGFDAASVGEIAAGADCVEGTLYVYFRNKRDLFDEVLAQFYDALIADIEPRFAAIEGTSDRLRYLIARHLQIAVDDPGMAGLIARETRGHVPYFGSRLHALNQRYSRFLTRTIKEGVERGELRRDLDVSVARDMVFGGIEHRVLNALGQGRRIDPPRLAREMAAIALNGWSAPVEAAQPAPADVRRIEQRLSRIEGQLKRRGANA